MDPYSALPPSAEFYRSSSANLPERQALIDACIARYIEKNCQTNNLLWPNDTEPQFFVKFGMGIDSGEAYNQIYFHNMTVGSTVIRIPELYWAFYDSSTAMIYIVMEYVENHGEVSGEEMGRALVELLSVHLPENAAPGPVGGGILHHKLFRHGVAGAVYNNNAELEEFINKSLRCLDRKQKYKYKVKFEEDDLVPYYTDLYYANFWKDERDLVCVADFDQAGFAPSAFMAMVLRSRRYEEVANVVLPHLDRVREVTESTLQCMNLALYANQLGRIAP